MLKIFHAHVRVKQAVFKNGSTNKDEMAQV